MFAYQIMVYPPLKSDSTFRQQVRILQLQLNFVVLWALHLLKSLVK